MSLLEWLKFWSKFYSLPLFCRIPTSPSPSSSPQMKIVRESKSKYRIPPPKMKIVRESKSEYRIPPQMKIVRESKSEYRIPPQMKIVRESKSEFQNTPPKNENFQRVQVRVQNTPPMKIVRESKSKSFRINPSPPKKIRKNFIFKFQSSLKILEIYVETNL